MNNYDQFLFLRNIDLEDSFLLNIDESENKLVLDMEFVLLSNHEQFYTPEKDGSFELWKNSRTKPIPKLTGIV